MPLVVVTGFPSSGKTRRCVSLAAAAGSRDPRARAAPRLRGSGALPRAAPYTLTPAYLKRRSHELAEYLRAKGVTVTLHNNESLGIDRNEAYSDSQVLLASARRGAQRASPQQ